MYVKRHKVRKDGREYSYLRFVEAYLRTPWLRTDLVDVPALAVCGRDDFAAVPAEAEALAADLPDAVAHLLPGCGHFLMAERGALRFVELLQIRHVLPPDGVAG